MVIFLDVFPEHRPDLIQDLTESLVALNFHLEFYVILENTQEIRIRVETRGLSQDAYSGGNMDIGWDEEDAVVLMRR